MLSYSFKLFKDLSYNISKKFNKNLKYLIHNNNKKTKKALNIIKIQL